MNFPSFPISFGQPLWFIALVLIPLAIALYVYGESQARKNLALLVAPKLSARLTQSVDRGKRALRFTLVLLGLVSVITALAQPRYGYDYQEIKRKGRDVVIALDTSKSMLADDVSPSRIGSAKLAILDLLRVLDGERVALVAFAGTAFLQAPLTIDQGALEDALDVMDTNIIPRGGTDISSAINTSIEAFGKAEGSNKAIVLFTDGEELEDDAIKAAKAAKEAGIKIFTVGVGSPEGGMIPLQESGTSTFQRDDSGQFVKTRLDEKILRQIAETTGGFYVRLQNGSNAVQTLVDNGINKLAEKEGDEKLSRRPIERYQWPLGLGLVLLMLAGTLSDRRRFSEKRIAGAAVAALLFLTAVPQIHAEAGGLELYEQGKYKESLNAFQKKVATSPRSPAWNFNAGAAAYKAENFDAALDAFGKAATTRDPALRKKAEYNAANTLFQRGARTDERSKKIDDWKTALTHYDEALKIDKNDANAKFNRDLVEKLLKEEDEKKKEQEKRDQKDKQDQQDQQQQQQQSQQSQQSKNQQNQQQQKNQNQQQQQGNQNQQSQQSGKDQQQQQKQDQNSQQQQQNQNQQGQNQQQQQPPTSGKNQQQQRGPGQSPTPEPEKNSGEKKEGELKAANAGQKDDQQKQDGQQQQVAAAQEDKDGEMSKDQARALLQAMQSEETRVNLRENQENQEEKRVPKDW